MLSNIFKVLSLFCIGFAIGTAAGPFIVSSATKTTNAECGCKGVCMCKTCLCASHKEIGLCQQPSRVAETVPSKCCHGKE